MRARLGKACPYGYMTSPIAFHPAVRCTRAASIQGVCYGSLAADNACSRQRQRVVRFCPATSSENSGWAGRSELTIACPCLLACRSPHASLHADSAGPSDADLQSLPDPSNTRASTNTPSFDDVIPSTSNTQCGFAALLGPSNSGKSTLLNRLVGAKVAIVTPKVQTTRCRVAGISVSGPTMVVYLDTPGVFRPNGRLDRAMVRAAWASASSGDVTAVILDAAEMYHRRPRSEDFGVFVPDTLEELVGRGARRREGAATAQQCCICLNKMDMVPDEHVEPFLRRFDKLLESFGSDTPDTIFPMSARFGHGVDAFVGWVEGKMPAGPWLYPGDDLTDMPMRLLAAEITREKAFMLLRHELPYDIAVETTEYKERPDKTIRITQNLLVRRSSQQRIVTGRNGAMIKAIGVRARQELGEMTGTTVHLILTVKVREQWKDDHRSYGMWGLEYNA